MKLHKFLIGAGIALLVGFLTEVAYGADEVELGKQYSATVSICDDEKLTKDIADTEAKDGFDAAVMLFNLAAQLIGNCGNVEVTFTPVKLVHKVKTKRGELNVVEIAIQGAKKKYYMLTNRVVILGKAV